MNTPNATLTALDTLLSSCSTENNDVQFINVSTTDGFPVLTITTLDSNLEEDKLAATSSTLCSVSRAVAGQILNSQFQTCFIETNNGNIVFVATTYKDNDVIVSMSAGATLNLATLRHKIKGLASDIAAL